MRSWMPALAFLVLAAPVASARTDCVPRASLSTAPPVLSLVGHTTSPDPAGTATFVVRDCAGNPVPGSVVMLDFSGCTDVALASDVVGAGLRLDCAHKSIVGFADITGSVRFSIVGSAIGGASVALPKCVKAYADGVPLPAPLVTTYDLDGVNGVGLPDVSIAAAAMFSGRYQPRCDFNGDGILSGLDISLLARVIYAGGSTASGALTCAP